MRTVIGLTWIVFAAMFGVACSEPHTDVQFTGSLTYGTCGEVLPWTPGFAMWTETNATDAVMRFEHHSIDSLSPNDTLTFVINDAISLLESPTTPITVGDREYTDARASANFALSVQCPDDISLSVYLHGTLVFEALSSAKNGPIRGTFTGDAHDQRTDEVIGTGLELYFDFERSTRTPWQPFNAGPSGATP